MNDWKFNQLQYELYRLRKLEERKYYSEEKFEELENERIDTTVKIIWFVIIPICLACLLLSMKYAKVF